jgi:hypothetical protein
MGLTDARPQHRYAATTPPATGLLRLRHGHRAQLLQRVPDLSTRPPQPRRSAPARCTSARAHRRDSARQARVARFTPIFRTPNGAGGRACPVSVPIRKVTRERSRAQTARRSRRAPTSEVTADQAHAGIRGERSVEIANSPSSSLPSGEKGLKMAESVLTGRVRHEIVLSRLAFRRGNYIARNPRWVGTAGPMGPERSEALGAAGHCSKGSFLACLRTFS